MSKKFSLPKIKLRKPEKIWLEKLYEKIKNNSEITYRAIRAELYKELPIDFNPNDIDSRLAVGNGEIITLLGICQIDPDNDLIHKTNVVINYIRDVFIDKPNIDRVRSSDISTAVNIPENEIGLILKIMSPYGRFWNGAGGSGEYYGYSSISFDGSNSDQNLIFDEYLYFENIEKLIDNYYLEHKSKIRHKLISKNEDNPLFPQLSKKESIRVSPIFNTRVEQIDYKLCFVLMPFTNEWSDRVYRNFIRKNIEEIGLQCLRADNLTGQIIIEDIWTKINQAAFIIADVTDKNPNVMYELGIAHTLGKPVVLITQNTSSIPFDFKHLRHYQYSDNSDGEAVFKVKLKEIVKNIYKEFYARNIT